MRYKHDSMLPLGAFRQRGSVVGGRSMRLHGGDGYVPDWEEARRMEAEHAARLAAQGFARAQEELRAQQAWEAAQAQAQAEAQARAAAEAQAWAEQVRNAEAQQAAQQRADELARQAAAAQVQAAYVAKPEVFAPTPAPTANTIDTANLTPTTPNWTGTPTVYTDANGNVKGVYTSAGVVPVESLNPLVPQGEQITADTLVQAVNAEGQKLYLTDMSDPNSVTTRNTGVPAIGGTVAEQAFVPPKDNSILGTVGGDFVDMAKDPSFWKFLAAAGAVAGAGLGANALLGAPEALGGATAFPVDMAGLLTPTELGAATGAVGTTGVGSVGAGGMSAADAIAAAAEGGLGAEFGVQGSLGALGGVPAAAGGGMSAADAIAAAAEGGLGAEFGTTAAPSLWESISAAFPTGATGSLIKGGLTLGGLAALSALAPKPSTGGTASNSLSAEQLQAIVAGMPSAMGNYLSMAGNQPSYGGVGVPYTHNQSLVDLFPGFSLPTAGPFYGAGRFGDYYAPQAASNTPISPTGLV